MADTNSTDRDTTGQDSAFADLDGDAISAWLADRAEQHAPIRSATKFPGGQSNPTYRLTGASGDLVLRRKPFGKLLPSAHAVDREFRVISALHEAGLPVPRPIALCEDESVTGSVFYLMQMVEGRTFWDGTVPGASPQERGGIYRSLVDALADLHNLDPEAIGLNDYGAPGNYFERQIRRWTKQYRASQTDDLPEVERLIEWLPETMPAQDRRSVIHGDYRIDNLIFEKDGTRALAILDWELSTLGDPLADFTYLAMNWAMPHGQRGAQLGGLDLQALGIPTLEEITERYCERTGRSGVPDMDWYFAYNLFRLVGILQGVKKRFLDGNASSKDAEEKAARILPLARQALQFAERAGA